MERRKFLGGLALLPVMAYGGRDIGKGMAAAMRQLFGKRAENGVPVLEAPTRIVTPGDPDFGNVVGRDDCMFTIQNRDHDIVFRGIVTGYEISVHREPISGFMDDTLAPPVLSGLTGMDATIHVTSSGEVAWNMNDR